MCKDAIVCSCIIILLYCYRRHSSFDSVPTLLRRCDSWCNDEVKMLKKKNVCKNVGFNRIIIYILIICPILFCFN